MMATAGNVVGLTEVLANLNHEIGGIKTRSAAGLLAAGLKVQRRAQEWVPVEYGELRASAYTRKAQGGGIAVEVGFTSGHALFVHENMEQRLKGQPRPSGLGVYWGPHGRPKFLEAAVKALESEILETVRAYGRVR